jgi:hypothetical protein
MNQYSEREPTLEEIELGVLAEGREWMRQRLQQKLQERAERIGQSFSPRGSKAGASAKTKANPDQQHRGRGHRD